MSNKLKRLSKNIYFINNINKGFYHYTMNTGHVLFQPRHSVLPSAFLKTTLLWNLSLKEGGLDECLYYPNIKFNISSTIDDDVASTLLSIYLEDLKVPLIHSSISINGTSAYNQAKMLSSIWEVPTNTITTLQTPCLIDVINSDAYILYIKLLTEKNLCIEDAGWTGDYCNCMGQVMLIYVLIGEFSRKNLLDIFCYHK
ncbi:hypothetical protein [Variimorphobacter saccharofermentans]|jgi:hypothetical protein|uniref:hypothetical protein n=1 Tax=Variimorphobacter saccharofermentans TaxID=2755051 RepID=UPI001E2AA3FB|nr:hypothetical protein [Variimorphobacter saccharofermentans]